MKRSLSGFTLLELLLVIAIITILAGVIFATTGPSREKARQTTCLSNLRQIGQALLMYRADYDDAGGTALQAKDAVSALAAMGVPPSIYQLKDYLKNQDVFHCPNTPPETIASLLKNNPTGIWTSYSTGVYHTPWNSTFPPFTEALSIRGEEYPWMSCSYHDFPPPDRPRATWYFHILRLNGSVTTRRLDDLEPYWKW